MSWFSEKNQTFFIENSEYRCRMYDASSEQSKSTIKSDTDSVRTFIIAAAVDTFFNKPSPYQHFIMRFSFNLSLFYLNTLFHCDLLTLLYCIAEKKVQIFCQSPPNVLHTEHLPKACMCADEPFHVKYINFTHSNRIQWRKKSTQKK